MENNPFSLEGLRILITGAASGIGRRTAIECVKLGAFVELVDLNEILLKEVYEEISEYSSGHRFHQVDLTNDEQIVELVQSIDPIYGCVNNAGVGGKNLPVAFIKREDVEKICQINSFSSIALTQALIKQRKIDRGGSIVFTASIAGFTVSNSGNTLYALSKNMINTYVKGVALELAGRKIRCNSVNPGTVNTPLIARGAITDEDREKDKDMYPLKRYGEPSDIAYAIIFLLSKASSWITGTHLIVDGGRSLI